MSILLHFLAICTFCLASVSWAFEDFGLADTEKYFSEKEDYSLIQPTKTFQDNSGPGYFQTSQEDSQDSLSNQELRNDAFPSFWQDPFSGQNKEDTFGMLHSWERQDYNNQDNDDFQSSWENHQVEDKPVWQDHWARQDVGTEEFPQLQDTFSGHDQSLLIGHQDYNEPQLFSQHTEPLLRLPIGPIEMLNNENTSNNIFHPVPERRQIDKPVLGTQRSAKGSCRKKGGKGKIRTGNGNLLRRDSQVTSSYGNQPYGQYRPYQQPSNVLSFLAPCLGLGLAALGLPLAFLQFDTVTSMTTLIPGPVTMTLTNTVTVPAAAPPPPAN